MEKLHIMVAIRIQIKIIGNSKSPCHVLVMSSYNFLVSSVRLDLPHDGLEAVPFSRTPSLVFVDALIIFLGNKTHFVI
jgi:hypothetical protein